jgi:murein DD-endopeptidase MepM/ murein hydrolase activator NlpD
LLKIINKVLIRIKRAKLWGFYENPLFYFGLISIFLFSSIYVSCSGLINTGGLNDSRIVFFNSFFNNPNILSPNVLFSSQANAIPLETPDLKTIQDNTLCAVATPCVVSGKVLGDIFGGNNQNQKEIVDYAVQPGDTLQSVADAYKISVNTLIWANGLTTSSTIKVGQSLTILPTDGTFYVVKLGDTISGIAQTYKAQSEDIVSYNSLANQSDIYIGDILIVPGGVMPKKASPAINQIPLANNFFIYPTQGYIAQGLHYYNAVDIANKCGTPIYAAAAGVVQRAVGNGGYNSGMGNHITILHSNGAVTYYGHLMTLMVKTGDQVYTGQNIGLMGGEPGMAGAGKSTGCHVHFQETKKPRFGEAF